MVPPITLACCVDWNNFHCRSNRCCIPSFLVCTHSWRCTFRPYRNKWSSYMGCLRPLRLDAPLLSLLSYLSLLLLWPHFVAVDVSAIGLNALRAVAVNQQHTHCHRRQPSTHSLPLLSTINALIAVAVNHQRTHGRHRQPSTHLLPLPSTIAVNHQHTLRRCRKPSTHSSLSPATINALIAVAGNHQRTHLRRRQPSTHSSPLPSTINALRHRQPSTHSSPLPSTMAVNH